LNWTPAFVPVATRATVRTLESDEIHEVGSQVLICNTYHLHVAPGEKIVKKIGGLHSFFQRAGRSPSPPYQKRRDL